MMEVKISDMLDQKEAVKQTATPSNPRFVGHGDFNDYFPNTLGKVFQCASN